MSPVPASPPAISPAEPSRRALLRRRFSRARRQKNPDGWRRILNLTVAVSALLVSLPLLALIACAVKCTSTGSVIYTQPRVGIDRRRARCAELPECRREHDHGGQVFTIYKFRTMSVCTNSGEAWAQVHDPRITPIGAVLRKHRLDELPQFLNVMRGEMNIVGPRPEQPMIFQQLAGAVDGYTHRQQVLPGITGWAQIHRHPDQCIEDVQHKVALDLEYMHRRSAAEDLRIMIRTLPVMLHR